MPNEGEVTLVLDIGSKFTKAGFAGEHFPRALLPSAVGRYRHRGLIDGFPDFIFGHEALQKRGLVDLSWPVQKGLTSNWDEIEKLWFHIFFKELHVPPETTNIFHVVHPLVPRKDREKMAEIFFESFAINCLNLMKSPVLALHASGRTTGVVYECGASSSYVTPVFEGFPVLTTTCHLTGDALTDRLLHMMAALGYSFTTPIEKTLIDDMKTKLCYVARNYKEECEKFQCSGDNQVKYDLPDGQYVLIGDEQFKCPELFFQPSLAGLTCPSIVEDIWNSIHKTDFDIRAQLFQNIVISGGATQFPGFERRVLVDLIAHRKMQQADTNIKLFVDEMPARQLAPWVGGSLMASLEILKGFWMTKQEYDDVGPDRVNYKFF